MGAKHSSKLLTACREGDLDAVKALIEGGVNPNVVIKGVVDSDTPLLAACRKGHLDIVEALLAASADANAANDEGMSPLAVATKIGKADIVRSLVRAGADPNQVCIPTLSHSSYWISTNTLHVNDIVDTLLKNKANPNTTNNKGVTPLLAVLGVSALNLKKPLQIHKYTPLHFATFYTNKEAMIVLLEGGANPNMPDDKGTTPLFLSCQLVSGTNATGIPIIARLLLKYGADPNVQLSDGSVALHYAVIRGLDSVVEVLLQVSKIPVDYDVVDINGRTPLFVASQKGNGTIVSYLLQVGADPNIADNKGTTPLIVACEGGKINVVSTLLQAGANPNKIDKNGKTSLSVSIKGNHVNIISMLVKAGANGTASLISASENGNTSMLSALLLAGIDPNVADSNGRTPLIAACEDGLGNSVFVLLQAGANPNIADNYGRTPLTVATTNNHTEIVIQLLEHDFPALAEGKDQEELLKECNTAGIDAYDRATSDSDDDDALSEAVTKAMSEGSGDIKVSLVTLHGPPGAGKTSIKRLLLGEPPLPPELQHSTSIVETPARAITTSKVGLKYGSGQLERIDEGKLLELLAGHIQQWKAQMNETSSLHSSTEANICELETRNNCISNELSSSDHDMAALSTPSLSASSIQMTDVLKDVAESLEHINQSDGISIFDMQWFHIIDSGGQPQFQDVLPLLFQSQSLHIVVIRLNERLDDKPKFRYIYKGKQVKCLPSCLSLTNFQIIERTCQLAQASCTAGNRQPPWVMVVGTHLDLIGQCNETLAKKNEQLGQLLNQYSNVLVPKSKSEIMFSVDAMVEGDQRRQYRDELEINVIKAPAVQESFPVPVKWLALEVELSRVSTEDQGIVSIDICYEIASNLGMTKEETDHALKYFTQVAIHLYYPKALPLLLFTQMKSVADRLSALISTSFTHPPFGPTGDRKRLNQYGIFSKAYLDKCCDQWAGTTVCFTNSEFLMLLEHLHIAVRISEDEYFLPCALPISDDGQGCQTSSSCDPLVYSWHGKIVPHSFFPTLIANLLQQKDTFTLPRKEEQKRHKVYLKCQKLPGGVCVVDATQWVELYYYGNQEHCPAIRMAVETSLSRVCEILHLPHMATPQFGFICNGLICDMSVDRHICTLTEGTHEATCSIGVTAARVRDDRQLCWLTQRDSNGKQCR